MESSDVYSTSKRVSPSFPFIKRKSLQRILLCQPIIFIIGYGNKCEKSCRVERKERHSARSMFVPCAALETGYEPGKRRRSDLQSSSPTINPMVLNRVPNLFQNSAWMTRSDCEAEMSRRRLNIFRETLTPNNPA